MLVYRDKGPQKSELLPGEELNKEKLDGLKNAGAWEDALVVVDQLTKLWTVRALRYSGQTLTGSSSAGPVIVITINGSTGAIFSGIAMVITLLIPIRKVFGLENYFTIKHFDSMSKLPPFSPSGWIGTAFVAFLALAFSLGFLPSQHQVEAQLAHLERLAAQEVVGERGNVVTPLPQRRQLDLDRVEAEQEVLAEPAGGDLLVQVRVGGRENANVDAPCSRGADPLHLASPADAARPGQQGCQQHHQHLEPAGLDEARRQGQRQRGAGHESGERAAGGTDRSRWTAATLREHAGGELAGPTGPDAQPHRRRVVSPRMESGT